jgi:sec-independent protein translocase protein TatC
MPLDQDPHDYHEEKEMSFLDHLEELRWHVVRSAFAIVFFLILGLVFSGWIFDNIIFAPARPDFITFKYLCQLGNAVGAGDSFCPKEIPFKVQSRFMTGQFTMQITAALVIGLILAFPYVFWEIWQFIKPGLRLTERKVSRGAVFWVSFLFITGVCFGYFVLCPISIWFFSSYTLSDLIVNEFDITSYVQTIVALVFGSGLLFQLPMVAYVMTKIGLLTPQFMRKYRKHAVVVILIVAAIITPPDPLSQTLISLPLYLLYEISIIISTVVLRNKAKQEAAEALAERTAS